MAVEHPHCYRDQTDPFILPTLTEASTTSIETSTTSIETSTLERHFLRVFTHTHPHSSGKTLAQAQLSTETEQQPPLWSKLAEAEQQPLPRLYPSAEAEQEPLWAMLRGNEDAGELEAATPPCVPLSTAPQGSSSSSSTDSSFLPRHAGTANSSTDSSFLPTHDSRGLDSRGLGLPSGHMGTHTAGDNSSNRFNRFNRFNRLVSRETWKQAQSFVVSFRDAIIYSRRLLHGLASAFIYSLRLLALLLVRVLLRSKHSSPHVRRLLCSLGLTGFLLEAEGEESVEKLLRSHMPETLKGPQGPLLPPRHERDRNKLTIVLDLDETLVCAYNTEGLPPLLHDAACEGGLQWFTINCSSPEELDEMGVPRVHHVTVYQRPGLKEFLAAASQIGEVVLFTAGLEGYARPLVDRIDPEGRISHRLYRSATVSTPHREHVKDLSMLGRDLRRTVLVDNNPFSFLLQPLNGVPCITFTGENSKDHQLLDSILPLLEHLDKLSDVRPYLLSRFQMLSWFRARGVPVTDPVVHHPTVHHPIMQTNVHAMPPVPLAHPMPPSLMQPCAPVQAIWKNAN